MFHDQKFIDRINSTPGCKQVGYDSGHWVTYGESAPQATKEIRDFLNI